MCTLASKCARQATFQGRAGLLDVLQVWMDGGSESTSCKQLSISVGWEEVHQDRDQDQDQDVGQNWDWDRNRDQGQGQHQDRGQEQSQGQGQNWDRDSN